MGNDEILTISELAQYLKVKPLTVYRWVKAGKIPTIHLDRNLRFRKSSVDKWLNKKEETPKPAVSKRREGKGGEKED